MEELTKLLASRRAHKAHVTKLRQKIDDSKGHNYRHTARSTQVIRQPAKAKETLKEFNDKIVVLLETPEDLKQDILVAEELDGLILEKVCVTERFTELTNKNFSQHASSHQDTGVTLPQPLQMGKENQSSIPSTSQTEQENQQLNPIPSTETPGNDHSCNLSASSQNSLITSPPVSTSHSFQSNRFPKLVLPSFNGNPLEWQSFWDTFRSAVHDNSTISDVQKFNYLRA